MTEVRGLPPLLAKLARLEKFIARGGDERTIGRLAAYIHGGLPPYPPEPPDSSYDRTGTLGRELYDEVRTIGGQFVGVIGSPTLYGPYVIDKERQAGIHSGRWWTLQEEVAKGLKRGLQIVADAIREILR